MLLTVSPKTWLHVIVILLQKTIYSCCMHMHAEGVCVCVCPRASQGIWTQPNPTQPSPNLNRIQKALKPPPSPGCVCVLFCFCICRVRGVPPYSNKAATRTTYTLFCRQPQHRAVTQSSKSTGVPTITAQGNSREESRLGKHPQYQQGNTRTACESRLWHTLCLARPSSKYLNSTPRATSSRALPAGKHRTRQRQRL